MMRHKAIGIEQERRDMIAGQRALYEYIAATESAKALDRAGDTLSGYDQSAADIVWSDSAKHRRRAEVMRQYADGADDSLAQGA